MLGRKVTKYQKTEENQLSCFSSMFLFKKDNIFENFAAVFLKRHVFPEEEIHAEVLNKSESTQGI